MEKFASLEKKLMAAARGVIVLLGVVFLLFAVWWAALGLPSAWTAGSDGDDAQKVSAVQAFSPDAKVFNAAIQQAMAGQSGVDADTFKLREAMKLPENAAHYDNAIQTVRGFAQTNAAQRARIESTAAENGEMLLAPPAFEAVGQYAALCEQAEPAAEAAAADATQAAAAAVDAAAEAVEAPALCGRTTVREIIADNLSAMLSQVEGDEDKLAIHKAYVAGLAPSLSAYLTGNAAQRDGLVALPEAQIARTLVSAYSEQFAAKLSDADSSDGSDLSRMITGVNPLAILSNPFVAGTLGFLLIFAYVMMMLSLTRIERHLSKD